MKWVVVLTGIILVSLRLIEPTAAAVEDAAHWSAVARAELQAALGIRPNTGVARNVVLFVGDGLGPTTATAARIYRGQQQGRGKGAESGHLVFERFPHLALLKTYSVDKQVPDSACSATALFCGVKANYETSGVDASVPLADCEASLNTSSHVHSVLKWAQEAGKLTGFVTTTRVTHATPAALFAHAADRRWECEARMPPSAARCKDIGRQLVEDEPGNAIRVIMGGGRQCLTSNFTITPEDPVDTWACQRGDGRDLLATWRSHKASLGARFAEVRDTAGLRAIDPAATDFVLGVFANGHMRFEHQRDTSERGTPSLAEMTRTAIKVLQKAENGYLLVVESGLIDQAHHRGHARRALHETVVLEDAVQEALGLTDPADTLLIVTSDHAHTLAMSGYPVRGADILGVAQASRADGVPYTTLSYATGTATKYFAVNSTHVARPDPSQEDLTSFDYQQQAAVANNEETHGGGDVTLHAIGPMAHLFHSLHEQSYVAYVVAYAAKIGPFASSSSPITAHSSITLGLACFVLSYSR